MSIDLRAHLEQASHVLAAAQRGDREAQSIIFTAHRDRIAQQILRMTGDPASVDDLVQEVFIAAFLALPGFRGDSQLSTWLYTIATNKVRSWWESQRRRRARELSYAPAGDTTSPTPEDDMMAAQQRDSFYDALGSLPDRLREAFVARAVEGLSLCEAAEALGAPISTISYRARRAEQLLCAALGLPWRGDAE
ncbi:MAG: sigma-70 family RNA polymerase sigma factor [Myxococcales bacterium]|nr:sigma-70 family RNA polymerase sigma factor [Myxococcales bacterium]